MTDIIEAGQPTLDIHMEEDARQGAELAAARAALAARIPTDQFFELPGRPTVVFQVRPDPGSIWLSAC